MNSEMQHEIYVSYADADEAWVIGFINGLKWYLRQQVGKIDDNFIWAKYLLTDKISNDTKTLQEEYRKKSKYVVKINSLGNQENVTEFHSDNFIIQIDKSIDLEMLYKKISSKMKELEKIEPKKTRSASLPKHIVITVTDTEHEAFYKVLKEKNIKLGLLKRKNEGYYYDFVINGLDCALIRPTEKGNIASQALVNKLVRHPPKLMIMAGVCGGFSERGVKLNDVIFANSIFGYESERFTDDEYRQGIQPKVYRASPDLLSLIANLKTQLKLEQSITIHHEKSLASGDKVLAKVDCDLRTKILDKSSDIYGIEMEGVGFFHAIWDAQIQTDAAIIKVVSDLAGEDMGVEKESKQLEAATIAAKVTLEILKRF